MYICPWTGWKILGSQLTHRSVHRICDIIKCQDDMLHEVASHTLRNQWTIFVLHTPDMS
jgi:hypothetical protein